MLSEAKKCQNCKAEFEITPEDFAFYEKLKVPPPTFCPECRLQRRLTWRNERILYRRKCAAPGHDEMVLSVISPEKAYTIYDQKYWWGDGWDPMSYGRKYDFNRTFFEQFADLFRAVPQANLANINDVNSEYCNLTYQSKNCYLNFASDMNEDTAYLYHTIRSKNSFDLLGSNKQEYCYETVHSVGCYKSSFLYYCEECLDSVFLYDCRNCQNCFGCVGLRNAKYRIFNAQYSKEEYEKEIPKYDLSSHSGRVAAEKKFWEFVGHFPKRFANVHRVLNVTGDYIENAKNCFDCYDIEGNAEDCRYVVYGVTDFKDTYDAFGTGVNVERCYEIMAVGSNVRDVLFSFYVWDGYAMRYSFYCRASSNCFGCVGLRNKEYCILNKQYSKEEYEALIPKIIEHMDTAPYVDKKGRAHGYGEYFPSELSPFAYNETIAQEYFPLSAEKANERGYAWRDQTQKEYQVTMRSADIPDRIEDISDSIANEIVACSHNGICGEQCTTAFRILPSEIQFYKTAHLPLPRLCPNCRHYARNAKRNPFKLHARQCQCAGGASLKGIYNNVVVHAHESTQCQVEFKTTYSPERPEIIYCEQCYQQEIQ